MAHDVSGIILAGGLNSRFGGIIKANIVIEGETIISRILSVLRQHCSEIIVATNYPDEFRDLVNVKMVHDIIPGAGPLGGIHAGIKSSEYDTVFAIAGDMPFPDSKIIGDQINTFTASGHDILTAKVGNRIETLHSVFSRRILNDLERFLSVQGRRSVRDFLNESDTEYFEIPDTEKNRRSFTNINFPDDAGKLIS